MKENGVNGMTLVAGIALILLLSIIATAHTAEALPVNPPGSVPAPNVKVTSDRSAAETAKAIGTDAAKGAAAGAVGGAAVAPPGAKLAGAATGAAVGGVGGAAAGVVDHVINHTQVKVTPGKTSSAQPFKDYI